MREVAWKLADRVLVYADWEGFCEMALPGNLPGGLLRWVSRLLATLGLTDGWWWVPYFLLGLLLGLIGHLCIHGFRRWKLLPFWAIGGLAIGLLPLVSTGNCVWTEPECAVGVYRTIGLAIALVGFRVMRPLMNHRWGLMVGALIGGALFMPLGIYPLYAVFVRSVQTIFRKGIRLVGIPSMVIVALAVVLECRYLYNDVSVTYALAWGNGIRIQYSFADVSKALRMERMAMANDWSGISKLAKEAGRDATRVPHQMETAFRILAEFRQGQLPQALFEVPIRHYHLDNGRVQLQMSGYLLMFNYGFLLPSRRQIYELVSGTGWTPTYYRYLGDIAVIRGETAIAYRDYTQLKRCPFFGEFAEKRLNALAEKNPMGFVDLEPIVAMAKVWTGHYEKMSEFYMPDMLGAETFIYEKFMELKAAPPAMVGMFLTAVLLNGQRELLFDNFKMLDVLFPPPNPWPVPVQEALLIHADILQSEGKGKDIPRARDGAIEPATVARYRSYLELIRKIGMNPDSKAVDSVLRSFGNTYWCYDWLTSPRTERKVVSK